MDVAVSFKDLVEVAQSLRRGSAAQVGLGGQRLVLGIY